MDAVPVAPGWRDRGLTCAVAPCDVARMLDGCDRRTTAGCRDFAILTMLVRLGLRSGEVAALSVDDIIWQIGELTVTGKGNRRDRLPLPVRPSFRRWDQPPWILPRLSCPAHSPSRAWKSISLPFAFAIQNALNDHLQIVRIDLLDLDVAIQ